MLFLSVLQLEYSRERSDWTGCILLKLNIGNRKCYSKIIFKYLNNIVNLFLIKKLMESEVCRPINSAHMYCLLLTWTTSTAEAKKKRGGGRRLKT